MKRFTVHAAGIFLLVLAFLACRYLSRSAYHASPAASDPRQVPAAAPIAAAPHSTREPRLGHQWRAERRAELRRRERFSPRDQRNEPGKSTRKARGDGGDTPPRNTDAGISQKAVDRAFNSHNRASLCNLFNPCCASPGSLGAANCCPGQQIIGGSLDRFPIKIIVR